MHAITCPKASFQCFRPLRLGLRRSKYRGLKTEKCISLRSVVALVALQIYSSYTPPPRHPVGINVPTVLCSLRALLSTAKWEVSVFPLISQVLLWKAPLLLSQRPAEVEDRKRIGITSVLAAVAE